MPLATALSRITHQAASVLGKHTPKFAGRLAVGGRADLCLVHWASDWQAGAQTLRSQSTFTPFAADLTGMALPTRVLGTWVAGRRIFARKLGE